MGYDADGDEMSSHRPRRMTRAIAEQLLGEARRGRRAAGEPLSELSELLAAAAADPARQELPGEIAALAAFRAAAPATGALATGVPRRKPVARLLSVKVAAVLAALATTGGVAVAAGAVPNPLTAWRPAPHPSHPASASASNRPTTGTVSPGGTGGPATSPPPANAGPGGSPPAGLVGLCQSYLNLAGSDRVKALDSPALAGLVAAAGGRERVTGYCATLLGSGPGKPSAHPTPPAHPSHSPKPHATSTGSPMPRPSR